PVHVPVGVRARPAAAHRLPEWGADHHHPGRSLAPAGRSEQVCTSESGGACPDRTAPVLAVAPQPVPLTSRLAPRMSKRLWLHAVRVGIVAGLLYLLLRNADLPAVGRALLQVNGLLLAAALAIKIAVIGIKARRWAAAVYGMTGIYPKHRVFAATIIGA